VGQLNGVLGEDVDSARKRGKAVIPGKVAQDIVGGIIPFRGVVREITGANAESRALQQAIYAGFARRAFLKGVGLQKDADTPPDPSDDHRPAQCQEKAEGSAPGFFISNHRNAS
jgi:hypothetical protein